MLTITRKTDYALVAMANLAESYPSVVRTRDLSRRRRIPRPVLQKILTTLTGHELLVSVQGPNGGYHLRRPPEEIALADVISAMEGSFRFTGCTGTRGRPSQKCFARSVCPVMGSMGKVHSLLEQCLTGISIADLASGTVPETVTFTSTRRQQRRRVGNADV